MQQPAIAVKRKEPPVQYEPVPKYDPDIKKPRLVPIDEVCAGLFADAGRKSIDLIKQHYQRRFANSEDALKLQKALAEREIDAGKLRQMQGDKTRLEQHLSTLASRVNQLERETRELTTANAAAEKTVENQQAVIDRLNLTIVNITKTDRRHWDQPPGYARF
jgi:hypothetical protein